MTTLLQRCSMGDLEFVNRVINNPKIRPYVSDDGVVGPMDASFMLTGDKYFVFRYGYYGLIIFGPFNFITKQFHIFILPEYQGGKFPYQYRCGIDAINWMFSNTDCKKIVGLTIHDFKSLHKTGLHREGLLTKSHMKDGKLYDLYIFGASKDTWEFSDYPMAEGELDG